MTRPFCPDGLSKRTALAAAAIAAGFGVPALLVVAAAPASYVLLALAVGAAILVAGAVWFLKQAHRAGPPDVSILPYVSHEIRTPLAAISGIAELLDGSPASADPKQQKLVKTLRSSAATLHDIVDDLSDYARLERGELTLERSPLGLQALLEEVNAALSATASARGIRLAFANEIPADLEVDGDPRRLRHALAELLGHLLLATAKGSLEVVAGVRGEALHLEVSSSASGLDPRRYRAVSPGRGANAALGLLVSLRLLEKMGADLAAEADRSGGSRLVLRLPLLAVPHAAGAAALRQA